MKRVGNNKNLTRATPFRPNNPTKAIIFRINKNSGTLEWTRSPDPKNEIIRYYLEKTSGSD